MITGKGKFAGIILCAIIVLSGALGYEIVSGGQSPTAAALPTGSNFNYVLTIIMENQHSGAIFGNSCCSYETSLANSYGLATVYNDIYGGSLPNYVALTSGSTQSLTDDKGPTSHPLAVTNIADRLAGAGLSWKAYLESMPGACYQSDSFSQGAYYVRHDPFVYYTHITGNQGNGTTSSLCQSHVVPAGSSCPNGASGTQILTCDSALLGDLNATSGWANYMWLTPNGCNDMHDCSTSTGDTYLSSLIPRILSSALFSNPANRAALFLVWDEYSPTPGAVWAGPMFKTGYKSSNVYNHYSAIRTIEDNWGLATMSTGDAAATPMTEFFTSSTTPDFGLSASPASTSFTVGGMATTAIRMNVFNGFTGTVTLSPSSPSGITASCLPGTLSVTVLVSVCAFSATGPASGTVTVTGTSGGLAHSVFLGVSAVSSGGSGSFVASQWSLTAPSPSSAVISNGVLTETVVNNASSYSGSFYSTAQYLKENGFSGPPLPVSTFTSHVNIGRINIVSSSYLYHVYMGLYFTLPSPVTAGGLTTSWIDGQVQVEYCSSSTGCYPPGYTYNSNLGNRFGYREILTTLGANSSYDFVNFDVQAYCSRAEAAWGIPSTPCTLVRVEPGMEGYGVNPFSIVWTTFSAVAPSLCNNGANNPPTCNLCPAGQTLVNGVCTSTAPNFGISASPLTASAVQGTAGTSVVTLTSINSFAGPIALSGLPSGPSVTVTINPSNQTVIAGGQAFSTLSISTTRTTPLGNYTVTVNGVAGTLSHSVVVSFTVGSPPPVPDFGISVNQASLGVVQGSSGASSITLTSLTGFAGNISLAATVSASSVTVSLGSSLVILSSGATGTTTLTVYTNSSTPAGTYSASVTGTSASLSHSVTISVIVVLPPDFLLASSPASINIRAGSSGSVTLTITSLNGFTGSLALTATPSSASFGLSFSPTSVALASGAQASSSLTTISPSNSESAGTYTVTVAGTSGGLSHSATVTIIVTVPITQPLQGSMSWTPGNPTAGQTVTFSASALNGLPPYAFSWTFGDGPSSSGATVSHTYSVPGNYTVRLNVTDASSVTATIQSIVTITMGQSITPLLAVPGSQRASAGTMLAFVISASNPGSSGPISISASNMPSGAVFTSTPGNPATGKFTWNPASSAQPGRYNVTFNAVQSGSLDSSSKIVTVELAGTTSTPCPLCGLPSASSLTSMIMIGAIVGILITIVAVSFHRVHGTRSKGLPSLSPILSGTSSKAAVVSLYGNPRTAHEMNRRRATSPRGPSPRKSVVRSVYRSRHAKRSRAAKSKR